MMRMRVAAGCLVLGAVINVLVAWCAAVWGTVGPGAMTPPMAGIPDSPEVPPLVWHTRVPDGWSAPTVVSAAHGLGIAIHCASVWTREATVIRTGWPLYSMRSALVIQSTILPTKPLRENGLPLAGRYLDFGVSTTRNMGMITLGPGERPVPNIIYNTRTYQHQRYLPLNPIWLGFLGNTIVVAVLVACIWGAARSLRRAVRKLAMKRAGRCRECGYSREGLAEGSVCPECGAGRDISASATQ